MKKVPLLFLIFGFFLSYSSAEDKDEGKPPEKEEPRISMIKIGKL